MTPAISARCAALVLVAACAPVRPPESPIANAKPAAALGVPLRPMPVIHSGAGSAPAWCWDDAHELARDDYTGWYMAIQIERAVLAELAGATKPPVFPTGTMTERLARGEHVYVVGPAAIEDGGLPAGLHATTSAIPAVADAFDNHSFVHLVQLDVAGDVTSPDRKQAALVMRLQVSGVVGMPPYHSRNYGLRGTLCVMAGRGDDLTVYTQIHSQS